MGGPIVKNKFFYLLDGERTLQHLHAPVLVAAPFQRNSGSFRAPFRETNLLAKLDYQLKQSSHAFYRFGYFLGRYCNDCGAAPTSGEVHRGESIQDELLSDVPAKTDR